MAKLGKYKMVEYDGRLPAHPTPEGTGELLFKSGQWELHFKGSKEYVHGGLTRYGLEAEPLGGKGCRVSIIDPENGSAAVGGFVLPTTTADEFARHVSTMVAAVEKNKETTARVQSGEWWVAPGAFKGLGFAESFSISECAYLGGWSGHAKTHGHTNILRIGKSGVEYRGMRTIFTIGWPNVAKIEVEGMEQASQRVTLTRAMTVGVFALAAKKSKKAAVIIVELKNGEEACFRTDKFIAPELRAKLAPLTSQIRVADARATSLQSVAGSATPASRDEQPSDPVDQIRRLGELRDHGLLTPEEFETKKRELLDRL